MSPGISITITEDNVTPALKKLMESLEPGRLAAKVGPAVVSLIEEHLASLGPNKKGWPSTRFYEKFSRNVRWVPKDNGVVVGILPAVINGRSVSLRQRVFGGAIRPQEAKALAIPISPVSYGHVPSDFPGLFMIKTGKGAYLVQYGTGGPEPIREKGSRKGAKAQRLGGNAGSRLNATINFLFKLSFGVDQDGDRDVLPKDDEILSTAVTALSRGLKGENIEQ